MAPELIVEVLSPGNTAAEMRQKTAEYLGAGVDRAWIAEPEQKQVQVHGADGGPTVLGPGEVLRGAGRGGGFTLALDALFEG